MLSSLYIIYQCMGGCGPWTVDWSILLVLYWKCFRNRWPIRAPGIDLSRDSRADFIWNQARELRVPFLVNSNGNLCSPHGYVSVYGSFWFAQPWLNCHGEKQKRQWGTRSTHIAWRTRSSFSAIVSSYRHKGKFQELMFLLPDPSLVGRHHSLGQQSSHLRMILPFLRLTSMAIKTTHLGDNA